MSVNGVPEEGGTVSGSGRYHAQQEIDITATPAQGYKFMGWSGDIGHIEEPDSAHTTVIMPASDLEITAQFAPTYQLTIAAQPQYLDNFTGAGIYAEEK